MDEELVVYLGAMEARLASQIAGVLGRLNDSEERNLTRLAEGFETMATRLDVIEARIVELEQRLSGVEKLAIRFSNDSLLLSQQTETARACRGGAPPP